MPIKVREIKAFNTNFHNMLAAFTKYFVSERKFFTKIFFVKSTSLFCENVTFTKFLSKSEIKFLKFALILMTKFREEGRFT